MSVIFLWVKEHPEFNKFLNFLIFVLVRQWGSLFYKSDLSFTDVGITVSAFLIT